MPLEYPTGTPLGESKPGEASHFKRPSCSPTKSIERLPLDADPDFVCTFRYSTLPHRCCLYTAIATDRIALIAVNSSFYCGTLPARACMLYKVPDNVEDHHSDTRSTQRMTRLAQLPQSITGDTATSQGLRLICMPMLTSNRFHFQARLPMAIWCPPAAAGKLGNLIDDVTPCCNGRGVGRIKGTAPATDTGHGPRKH